MTRDVANGRRFIAFPADLVSARSYFDRTRTALRRPVPPACVMQQCGEYSRRTRKVSPSSGSATPRFMSRRRTPTPSWRGRSRTPCLHTAYLRQASPYQDNMFPSLNKFNDPFRSSINEDTWLRGLSSSHGCRHISDRCRGADGVMAGRRRSAVHQRSCGGAAIAPWARNRDGA